MTLPLGRILSIAVISLAATIIVAGDAAAQNEPLQCYGCTTMGTWPYGGLRCLGGAPGGSSCTEFINNDTHQWECHLSGTCGAEALKEGDQGVKVIELNGAMVLAQEREPGVYLIPSCSGWTLAYVDSGLRVARTVSISRFGSEEMYGSVDGQR